MCHEYNVSSLYLCVKANKCQSQIFCNKIYLFMSAVRYVLETITISINYVKQSHDFSYGLENTGHTIIQHELLYTILPQLFLVYGSSLFI